MEGQAEGQNYVLGTCPTHGKVQHAVAGDFELCVPCLVQNWLRAKQLEERQVEVLCAANW